MKEIGMKKAARDQLPQLESDWIIELGYKKMANRPEREPGQQPWAGYRFQRENRHVYADQYSCESRHKISLSAYTYFLTKVTEDHGGHNVAEIWLTTNRELTHEGRCSASVAA
jgi:hypothetical protein